MTVPALDLPPAGARLEPAVRAGLARVEDRLREVASQADRLADRASLHLIEAGGKRMRPMLTLLTAHLGDPDRPEVVDAAVAVELTHLATLYHDDVIDSAPVRRGAPAAHQVWGNTVAILTGDLLFARASRLVAGLGPDAVRTQAGTFERLCLGQLRETTGPAHDQDPVDFYLSVIADKTGSLIATAARFGAQFSGAPAEVLDPLVVYGEKVGVAFQLADDVIDLMSDGSESGKTPGTDLREGVATLPVLLVRQAAARDGDSASLRLVELLDGELAEAELAEAVRLLREHPAMSAARAEAERWAARAVDAVADLGEGEVAAALAGFAEAVVARTR